jgi:hypothetical protein
VIVAPSLRPAQAEAWHALFDLYERLPTDWALVGGQMVQSLCWEREATSNRPTVDADVGLDVRARPNMLMTFTRALHDLGFRADGQSFEGHQHRWIRGAAQIDVLIPRFLGETAESRRGATGGTTIAAPGTQGALWRSVPIGISVDGREGIVPRPTLQGALLSKAAAVEIVGDDDARHLVDIATLGALITRRDGVAEGITETERRRILAATSLLARDPRLIRVAGVDETVIERLRLAFARPVLAFEPSSTTSVTTAREQRR